MHGLPPEWLSLRHACERITADPAFWYRKDLQEIACNFAKRASEILHMSQIHPNGDTSYYDTRAM